MAKPCRIPWSSVLPLALALLALLAFLNVISGLHIQTALDQAALAVAGPWG